MTLVVAVLALMLLGAPLFVVLGGAAVVAFAAYVPGYDAFFSLDIVARKMAELTNQNVFLAIPFFVLSGAIMSAGGISRRLVAFAESLVGWMRGGLAVAAVGACAIFAAISGSSPVTLIAIGGLMYPAMVKAGYPERFSMGLVTTAGSLGMLIPPSVPMLIYAISVSGSASVNVSDMFMAGVLPGLLLALFWSVYAVATTDKSVPRGRFSFAQVRATFADGVWSLLLPILILGTIYGGVLTPTEAAAASVPYALFVEFAIHREIKPSMLPEIVIDSIRSMGTLVMIIMLSMSLNMFMVEKGLGELVLEQMKAAGFGAVGFLMMMNVFLLIIGMLMDSISAIVLFTPLLVPAAVGLGLDPLHVGIVFIINMEIGYMTPPVGANLFVAAGLFKKPFLEVVRSIAPTLGILAASLLLFTYVPSFATGPVYALKGEAFWRPLVAAPAPAAPPALEPAHGAPAPAAEGKVLSLEEMMKAAKAGAPAEPPPPAPAEGRVMSLEEMMEAAKARQAAEQAP
jgi:C4-dicarboxylate transporter DctM subunit